MCKSKAGIGIAPLLFLVLASCTFTAAPTAMQVPSPLPVSAAIARAIVSAAPTAASVALPPTVPRYPTLAPWPTRAPRPTLPPPTVTPTPPPLPVPGPAQALLEAVPGVDFDLEQVALLGISQTEGVTLQARLRSGEMRLAPLSPHIVPVGVTYRTLWKEPYLLLVPVYQPVSVTAAPLLVMNLVDKMFYHLQVPRGYWVSPYSLPAERRQMVLELIWLAGEEYGYRPSGPLWEVSVWDMTTGQVQVLLRGDDLDIYGPVYWSEATEKLYLTLGRLESDVGERGLAAIGLDGSGWQEYELADGALVFAPGGLSAAYLAYDAQLRAGYTYYDEGQYRLANQLWVLDLQTGASRLLLQAEDGAQYYQFEWTDRGLLLERTWASSHATIGKWDLVRVDPSTGETSLVIGQEGERSGPPGGPFSPWQDRWLMWDWMDEQYTMVDLETGQMQNVAALIPEHGPFLWCAEGTALIDQFGGQAYYVDLEQMRTDPLEGWWEVSFCR